MWLNLYIHKQSKNYSLLLSIVLLFFVISIGQQLHAQPVINNGSITIQNKYFDTGNVLSLDGEWEFYWNELINENFDAFDKELRSFTKNWADDHSSFGFATYRLVIDLPKKRPDLALQIPDFYSSYELFINGKLFASNGQVNKSKETYTPKWLPLTLPINLSDTNRVELVLHVANFHHKRGGAHTPITIGASNVLAMQRESELAYSYVLTGVLLMGGFIFLGLYLFGKQEKAILYFSIFCLFYTYRIVGFGIYPIHFLFPDVPWIVTLRLEYLTLFLSGLFFGIYTLNLYPNETSRLLIKILSIISTLFVGIALFFPAFWFTQLVVPYFIILISYILYAFFVYTKAILNKREGATFALASTGVVFFVFLYEMMVYFGVFERALIFSFLGYLFFFFFQSLVLTYRFSTSIKKATRKAEAASIAKSQFLSTMSHEIRTPLNAIIGLSGLLVETPLNKTQDDYVKTVKVSGENLLSIVNNILDYSKIESSGIEIHKSEVAVQELIENVLDLVAPLNINTSVELIYDIDESVSPFIIADKVKLQQILINLVNNAVKFTEKGEVFVQLKMDKSSQKSTARLDITIKDTGIGISPKGLKKLFKSFSQVDASTTRKYGGTGLGLVISKRLIEALGGEISVKSKVGEGTQFFFHVEVERSSKKLTPYQSSLLKGKKALFLDDNPTNLKIFKEQAATHHLEIVTTTDSEYVTTHLDTLDQFDFIVLDMQMPLKDGVEVAKEIREKWDKETLPLVLLSSIHAIENKSDFQLFNLQLTKPVKQSQLFRTLEGIFSDAKTIVENKNTEPIDFEGPQTANILVAEDNIFNQKVASKILERQGFNPIIVENGKMAFDEVLTNNYDLVFMDVEMPIMDGIEATKTLRANQHKLSKRPIIIAMTANVMAEDKKKCLDAGMDDFISKPVTVDALKKMLKKWL
ncbi:MAG: response regulator [Balneola sp.]